MRTHLERTARVPTWIAGASICLLAAAGIVAIVRSIPASYATIPDTGALSTHVTAPSRSDDANSKDTLAYLAPAVTTINRRSRAGCRECGVIESMRRIERASDVSEQHKVEVEFAGAVSGSAIVSNASWRAGVRIHRPLSRRINDGVQRGNLANVATGRPGSRDRRLECFEELTPAQPDGRSSVVPWPGNR